MEVTHVGVKKSKRHRRSVTDEMGVKQSLHFAAEPEPQICQKPEAALLWPEADRGSIGANRWRP